MEQAVRLVIKRVSDSFHLTLTELERNQTRQQVPKTNIIRRKADDFLEAKLKIETTATQTQRASVMRAI